MTDSLTPRPPAPETSNPRAFSQGCGYLFTIAGLILLFGGCCIGSFSGLLQGQQAAVPQSFQAWLRQSPTGQLLTGMNIVVSGAAGLALLTFGVGLQHDRRGSGLGAMVTTGALAFCWWATTAGTAVLLVKDWSRGEGVSAGLVARVVIQLAVSIVVTGLFLLAGAARRTLRLYPPPPDEPVTKEFLAQLARHRHLDRENE